MAADWRHEPIGITLHSGRKLVEISWGDGHSSAYPFDLLRWNCPCASCQGEMGRPGQLTYATELMPVQKQMVDLQLVGRYALQPRWADGHDTGIYTFEDLRRLCPCDLCRLQADRS